MTLETKSWRFYRRFWRIQIDFEVMRHIYGGGASDRWVFHPHFIYDCVQRRGET